VLVIDAGDPRNAPAGQVHNYLGREGTSPGELLAIGRREVEQYGVQVLAGRVVSATDYQDLARTTPGIAKAAAVVTWQLEHRPHPEQGYRACLGLLALVRRYSAERLLP